MKQELFRERLLGGLVDERGDSAHRATLRGPLRRASPGGTPGGATPAAGLPRVRTSLRVNSLTLPRLAAEVMTAAFGPGCPGADDEEYFLVAGGNARSGPSTYRIAEVLMTSRGINFPVGPMKDRELQERIVRLIAEGLQELEHASLVRAQVHNPPQVGPDYTITRRGRAALERGEVEGILMAASA